MKRILFLSLGAVTAMFGYLLMSYTGEPLLLYHIVPSKLVMKIDTSLSIYKIEDPQITRMFINNSDDAKILYEYYTQAFQDYHAIIDSARFQGVSFMIYDSNNCALQKVFPPLDFPTSDAAFEKMNKVHAQLDSQLYTYMDDVRLYGFDENPDKYFRRVTLNNKRIIPSHDTLVYKGVLDLSLFYRSLKPGKYKIVSYYYIDEDIEREIGNEVYEKEKDKILMGLYKANEIELIVE